MNGNGWLAYAVLMVGVIGISWSAIFIRGADAPALTIGFYRMLISGVPMGALAVWYHRRSPEPTTRHAMWLLLLSAVLLAAHFAFWVESLNRTSVATSVVLVAAQPLYVAIASPLLLNEPVERYVWFAITIAMAGALIMAAEDLGDGLGTLTGDLFALLGGITSAGYFMVGRRVRPEVSWPKYVGIVYPLSAVFLFALVLIARDPITGFSAKTWLMFILLAVVSQLIGHSAINWSLAYLSAVIVSIAILLEPLITTLLAIPILDETPTLIELAGGLLVLAGVYLAIRPRPEQRLALEVSAAD
jgi:drug/metabolite transporter (DMT)-like permease